MYRFIRRWLLRLLALVAMIATGILGAWLWIASNTEAQIYTQVANIPASSLSNQTYDHNQPAQRLVGLVLGTSPWSRSGRSNRYFTTRIAKAAELYQSGKVDKLIVSGDNRQKDYNEPVEMQLALVALGIPENDIVLDYAGFRTLDSIVRAKTVFAAPKIVVVSQHWHNQRAVYIANQHDLPAIAVDANEPSLRYGLKTRIREILAKMWMLVDVHILDREPHHPGPAEPIYPAS